LLGKLYVSPASEEGKIRSLYEDVNTAVEDNLLSDATSRNALYKIHVSLGKLVNQFTEQAKGNRRSMSRSMSMSMSVAGDDKTATEDSVLTQQPIKEEEASDHEDDNIDNSGDDTIREHDTPGEESLVQELLSDGD
jgi:condensin complex subunit 3